MLGRVLKLGRVATATAMVFFHRFFSRHKFSEHDRFEVAVACVLLAAKTEEAPRKLQHVIQGKLLLDNWLYFIFWEFESCIHIYST